MKKYLKTDEWNIIEDSFHADYLRMSESIFSLGNGRFGQRGNFEEPYSSESGFDMSLISMKKKETGKYHIDLWEANRIELLNLGVPAEQIEVAGICTYIHHDEFFSARRLGIDSGRTLSGIMIRK